MKPEDASRVPSLSRRLCDAGPGLNGWAANFAVVTIMVSQGLHPEPTVHPDMPPAGHQLPPLSAVAAPAVVSTSTASSMQSIGFTVRGFDLTDRST